MNDKWMRDSNVTSRRWFLGGSAALITGAVSSYAGTANHFAEIEARIARRDLKNINKEDLPTPSMIVDQEIFEANLKRPGQGSQGEYGFAAKMSPGGMSRFGRAGIAEGNCPCDQGPAWCSRRPLWIKTGASPGLRGGGCGLGRYLRR